jgi:hypothetical protein
VTEHPAKGCTKRQIGAFEAIAVGQAFGHHPKVIDGLLRKGLIEITEQTVGRDRFGSIIVRAAYVQRRAHDRPIPILRGCAEVVGCETARLSRN